MSTWLFSKRRPVNDRYDRAVVYVPYARSVVPYLDSAWPGPSLHVFGAGLSGPVVVNYWHVGTLL